MAKENKTPKKATKKKAEKPVENTEEAVDSCDKPQKTSTASLPSRW